MKGSSLNFSKQVETGQASGNRPWPCLGEEVRGDPWEKDLGGERSGQGQPVFFTLPMN